MTRNDLLTLAQRLREYNHNPHHINPTSEAFHNLIAESASAISMLATPPADAADMGGQAGEEVEVMAYAVDHPEAGYKVYKQFSQWMNGGEWRCDSLMTVAQHQRIVAALSAQQSAHVSVPRDIAMALLDDGPRAETWKAQAALRALLNGGEA